LLRPDPVDYTQKQEKGEQRSLHAPPKKDSPPAPVPVLSPVCTRKSGTTLAARSIANENRKGGGEILKGAKTRQ
jgi:hypothetical protein